MGQARVPFPVLTRRGALGYSALAAAAVAAGSGTLGGTAVAAPGVANPVIQLYYSAGGYESTRSTAALTAINELLNTYFVAKNPGIRLKVNFDFHGNTMGLMAALLGGEGPDVFEEWYDLPVLIQQGMLLDIMPYVRASNLNLNLFMPGEISEVTATNVTNGTSGLFGLPAYVHQQALLVNLGLLDQLGIAYPNPEWNYLEAEHLWRAAAGVSGTTRRLGSDFRFQTEGPDSFYLRGWGGSYVDPKDAMHCTLDQPAALSCGEWLFGLMAEQVVGTDHSYSDFQKGILATMYAGSDGGMPGLAATVQNMKVRFYLMPRWPKGWFTAHAEDFHAIYSGTKYPEQSWELLRFLSTNADWQRGLIQLFLAGPALDSLWPEYTRIVEEYAPPLRNTNLEVFTTQAALHMPVFRSHFQYASDTVYGMIGAWSNKIQAQHLSVASAWSQAAAQTNAFESAQAQEAASSAASAGRLLAQLKEAVSDPGAVTFSAPLYAQPGAAPTKAPQLATTSHGAVAVTGVGAGLAGSADGGTFAGQPWTKASGTFSVRLTGISNVNSPTYLSSGASAGLAIRTDLSPSAREAALVVASNRGVHWKARPVAGLGLKDQRPRNYPGTGLLLPQGLLHDGHKPHANYLIRPVWLRLVRHGQVWTAFTSLDGTTWMQAGLPVGLLVGGVWVGLFVTPRDSNLGNKPYAMKATFDHISGFSPDTVVTIGTA